MHHESSQSRRAFLRRMSGMSLAALGGGALLTACGGGSADTQSQASAPQAAAEADGFSCMDVSGLTEAEVNMRNAVQYVDESPEADKNCLNCQLYTEPAAGSQCGGCTLIKGPIHPEGYCISWAPKAT